MRATVSLRVPVELISRFCSLLIYICLHGPAVSSFCLGGREELREERGLWSRLTRGPLA